MREESGLLTYAKSEMGFAGILDSEDEYTRMVGDAVLELIGLLSKQGHSGFSAGMAISMFERLAKYRPLSPLTGEDSEWMEIGDNLWQNVRCSRVFKNADSAWDIDGKVFVDPGGAAYTSKDSVVPVTFPYSPETVYVKVEYPVNSTGV